MLHPELVAGKIKVYVENMVFGTMAILVSSGANLTAMVRHIML
jgi:hypothetical protein